MSDLKKSRAARKGALVKAYADLSVLLAEDDYDAAVSKREHLKMLYHEFKEVHTNYHVTLQDETDIESSDAYFSDVQQLYITQQNTAKATLHDRRPPLHTGQILHTEQSLQGLSNLIHLPPLELKKFSGEPDEFDDFVATFQEVIGNAVSNPAAKLVRLKSQLTGIALDSIKMCRTDSGEEGYIRAMDILRNRFGSPYIVCNSVIERLKYGPDVRCPAEVRTFADELLNAEMTLKNNNMFTEIDTQNNIIDICQRLDQNLRYEWRSRVMKSKRVTGTYLNFSEFVIFMQEHADVVNDPIYGKDALKDHPHRKRAFKSVSSLPVATHNASSPNSSHDPSVQPYSTSVPSIQCPMCSKHHKLYTCYAFRSMPIDKRYDYVKNNKLCVLCLSNDHSVSECGSPYVCKINNCGEKHSSSLHVYPNVQLPSLTSSVHSNDNSNVYMPTVPVVIDGIFHTSALLDTGSSTTFCTKRLVEELKLQGVKMSYKLQTLHGSKDRCSDVVDFQVSSEDRLKRLYMRNVLVVEDIPLGNPCTDDVSGYPHLKDLMFSHESRVDLLIGQDNSAALVPLDVRHGPVGAPFATLTLMGWTLNGSAPVKVPGGPVTSHLVSAIRQNVREHQHKECNDVPLHDESPKTLAADIELDLTDNLNVTINGVVVILCLIWFFLSTMSLYTCIHCLCSYAIGHVPFLEASYASMGGVLLLVYYISYVVTYCVYLYSMSHPSASMISDARQYTLTLYDNFCNHRTYLT